MVYTPYDEGSCFDSGCGTSSYGDYCAYHGYTNATYGPYPDLVYANQPFPTSPNSNDCTIGEVSPNHNVTADESINVSSHELTESITDPLLGAWRDASGYEIGDECAWEFGSTTTGGGDVYWNSHPYEIQPEGDNVANGCVLQGP